MDLVKDTIQIFSKDKCIYCDKAKSLLNDYNVPFKEIKLSNLDKLKEITNGHNTFPFVFFGDEFIGGYTELRHSMLTDMPQKLISIGIKIKLDDF